jgi:hypothetical protein
MLRKIGIVIAVIATRSAGNSHGSRSRRFAFGVAELMSTSRTTANIADCAAVGTLSAIVPTRYRTGKGGRKLK